MSDLPDTSDLILRLKNAEGYARDQERPLAARTLREAWQMIERLMKLIRPGTKS